MIKGWETTLGRFHSTDGLAVYSVCEPHRTLHTSYSDETQAQQQQQQSSCVASSYQTACY